MKKKKKNFTTFKECHEHGELFWLGGRGRSPLSFLKIGKKFPGYGKNCPVSVHQWIKYSFEMQF